MRTKHFWTLMAMLVTVAATSPSCRHAAPTASVPAPPPVAAPSAPTIPAAVSNGGAAGAATSARVVVELTAEGFVPSHIPAEAGKPITLAVTRKTEQTCAHEILIKGQPGKTDLPLGKEVEVTFTPKASGAVPFGCAMGMMVGGVLEVR